MNRFMLLTVTIFVASSAATGHAQSNQRSSRAAKANSMSGSSSQVSSHYLQRVYIPREENKMKVRVDTIHASIGDINLDLSMRIGHTGWSAGGIVSHLQRSSDSQTGNSRSIIEAYGLGATTSYYFSGSPSTDSFFLNPRVLYRSGKLTTKNLGQASIYNWDAEFTLITAELMAGYQWHWENFNLGLAIGQSTNKLDINRVTGYANNVSIFNADTRGKGTTTFNMPNLELALGYSF